MIIQIQNLKFKAYLGFFAWEKKRKRNILFHLQYQLKKISTPKVEMEQTVDYDEITRQIENFLQEESFDIIEDLVYRLAHHLKKNKNIEWLTLECVKPYALAKAESVSAIYTLGKKEK